jgi:hypothetical protein
MRGRTHVKLGIRDKVLGGFAVALLLLAVASVYSVHSVRQTEGDLEAIFDRNLTPIAEFATVQSSMERINGGLVEYTFRDDVEEGPAFREDVETALAANQAALGRYCVMLVATGNTDALSSLEIFEADYAAFEKMI